MDDKDLFSLIEAHYNWDEPSQTYTAENGDASKSEFTQAFIQYLHHHIEATLAKLNTKRTYKTLSLETHPDRVTANSALDYCQRLSETRAFNLLSAMTDLMERIEASFDINQWYEEHRGYTWMVKGNEKFSALVQASIKDFHEKHRKENVNIDRSQFVSLLNLHISKQSNSEAYRALNAVLQSNGGLKAALENSIEAYYISVDHAYKFPIPDSKDDVYQWIAQYKLQRAETSDPILIGLLNSGIFLLEQISRYQFKMGEIRSVPLTVLSGVLPFFMAGISLASLGSYAPALCMLSAISYVINNKVKQNNNQDGSARYLAEIRKQFYALNGNFYTINKMGLFTLLGMNFVICNNVLYLLHTGSAAIGYSASLFLPAPLPLRLEIFKSRHSFNYPFVALISYEIYCYNLNQSQQYFSQWRSGNSKAQIFDRTLQKLKGIDASALSSQEACRRVKDEIHLLALNESLVSSGREAKNLIVNLQLKVGDLRPETLRLEDVKSQLKITA